MAAQPKEARACHADGGWVGETVTQTLVEPPIPGQLFAGAGVGPEDGWTQWTATFVHEDHAVHLA
jgi:hypothetical protein